MNKSIAEFIVENVQSRIGVDVNVGFSEKEPVHFDICPEGAHPNDSFIVRFSPGWRSVCVELLPGKYSAQLIAQMGRAPTDARNVLATFGSVIELRKAKLTFRVNGIEVSPHTHADWPTSWSRLELSIRSAPQVVNPQDLPQMRQLVVDLVIPFFGMVAALVGVEDVEERHLGESEGSSHQRLITSYERKKINREACIQLKGAKCAVCGFDFEEFYGDVGIGYIEVHHTTPVSKLGPDYRIDLITDLEPLCANCHSMVHRETPPIPVNDLARVVADRRSKQG